MSTVSLEVLSTALVTHARPGLRPHDLLSAVRRKHPTASRPELVRAAFYASIELADDDLDKARVLQNFAIAERGGN